MSDNKKPNADAKYTTLFIQYLVTVCVILTILTFLMVYLVKTLMDEPAGYSICHNIIIDRPITSYVYQGAIFYGIAIGLVIILIIYVFNDDLMYLLTNKYYHCRCFNNGEKTNDENNNKTIAHNVKPKQKQKQKQCIEIWDLIH